RDHQYRDERDPSQGDRVGQCPEPVAQPGVAQRPLLTQTRGDGRREVASPGRWDLRAENPAFAGPPLAQIRFAPVLTCRAHRKVDIIPEKTFPPAAIGLSLTM